MTGLIDLFPAFESDVLFPTTGTGPVVQSNFLVTGWRWWALVGAMLTLENGGGAVAALPRLQLFQGNIIIASIEGPFTVAATALERVMFGHGASTFQAVGVAQSCGFPFIPFLGEGNVLVGTSLGDAATRVSNARVIIIGRRYANRVQL